MNRENHTTIDADSMTIQQLYEALSGSFANIRIPSFAAREEPQDVLHRILRRMASRHAAGH